MRAFALANNSIKRESGPSDGSCAHRQASVRQDRRTHPHRQPRLECTRQGKAANLVDRLESRSLSALTNYLRFLQLNTPSIPSALRPAR